MQTIKCQVCGKEDALKSWNKEFERFKQSPDHTYICHNCAERIRAEAKDSQGH